MWNLKQRQSTALHLYEYRDSVLLRIFEPHVYLSSKMFSNNNFSRRDFLKGLSYASLLCSQFIFAPDSSAKQAAINVLQSGPLDEFDYGDLKLGDCLFQDQFEKTMNVILHQSEDGLLKPFRLRAGLPAPGEDMGGWYDEDPAYNLDTGYEHGFAPGHSFGQWISALCRAYAITGNPEMKAKAERLIDQYSKTISPKFYEDFRWPTYTFDKINLGLIDAHKYLKSKNAFSILAKTTDTALPFFPERALDHDELRELPHKNEAYCWDENYTLPENLFIAYQRGAGDRYRQLAIRFLKDDTYFNPLSEGKNVLPDHHAYSYTNALSSAMQAYLTLGSKKHLRAAANAFDFIQTTQSYATGGWGPDERFRSPDSDDLFQSLSDTHKSFETPCGSYAHLKLARYLLRVTGDSKYGDSIEQVIYNTVLGAKNLQQDGHAFYYSDNNFDGKKVYHKEKWTCCSGTLPQVTCDYHVCAYFHKGKNLYVNLYVPSTLTWNVVNGNTSKNITITQTTDYPFENKVQFKLAMTQAMECSMHFRIPAWTNAASLKVNGKDVSSKELVIPANKAGFASIERKWHDGDSIELELPMKLQLIPINERHPDVCALVYGPSVLFGLGATKPKLTREQLLGAQRTGKREWTVKSSDAEIKLRPFTSIFDEPYSTYFQLS